MDGGGGIFLALSPGHSQFFNVTKTGSGLGTRLGLSYRGGVDIIARKGERKIKNCKSLRFVLRIELQHVNSAICLYLIWGGGAQAGGGNPTN